MASQAEIDASNTFPCAWQVRQENVKGGHLDMLAERRGPDARLPTLLRGSCLEQHTSPIICTPPLPFVLKPVDGGEIDELINYARQEGLTTSGLERGRSMSYISALIKNASCVHTAKEMIEILDLYLLATGTHLHPRYVGQIRCELEEKYSTEEVDSVEREFQKVINIYLDRR